MRLGLGQFNTLTDEMLTFIKQIGVDDFLMTPFGAPWTASTAPTTGSTSAWAAGRRLGHDNVVRAIRHFGARGAGKGGQFAPHPRGRV